MLIERRELGTLVLLRLGLPDLARVAQPGQLVLLRCAPPGSADPYLRRPLFLAGVDSSTGTVDLLVQPVEPGLAWLAARSPGERLDLYGPVGNGFRLDRQTRNLLLAGVGPALPALFFLARHAIAHGLAVVLLAAAPPDLLPPPYLLPPAVEYQSSTEGEGALPALLVTAGQADRPGLAESPIAWADQVGLALTLPLLDPVGAALRAGRLRWQRGFAQAAIAGQIPCGLGLCQACHIETRAGIRLRCKDGPVFDLYDLRC